MKLNKKIIVDAVKTISGGPVALAPETAEAKERRLRNLAQNHKKKQERRGAYIPKENCAANPLLNYPRNKICFCGKTQLKAKKCCMPKLALHVPLEDANRLSAYMRTIEGV